MKNPNENITLQDLQREDGLAEAREMGREFALAEKDNSVDWDAMAEDEEMMSLYESGLLGAI